MTDAIKPLGPMKKHYWLAQTMAKASGADLVQAFDDGRLSQEDWATMVHRCRSCTWAQQCKCWLSDQDWGALTVPDDCVNSSILLDLLRPVEEPVKAAQ